MLKLNISHFSFLKIDKLVFDYNGTLACDGIPIQGVKEKINKLASDYKIYILTADTFGTVKKEFDDVKAEIVIINSEDETQFKRQFINKLGSNRVIAIGNGSNDALMLKEASLGILIIGPEGASSKSLLSSDLVVRNINDVFEILLNPKRLVASLRG